MNREEIRACVRLYLITDDTGRSPGELADTVRRAIEGGVTAVQLREKHASPQMIRAHVAALTPCARKPGCPCSSMPIC